MGTLTNEEARANPSVLAAMGKAGAVAPRRKRSKYGAVRTLVDGIWFDSKKEAARYMALKILQQVGQVLWFSIQGQFILPSGVVYKCDFIVAWPNGSVTIEDVKGGNATKTKTYRLKRRQVESIYRVKITEV